MIIDETINKQARFLKKNTFRDKNPYLITVILIRIFILSPKSIAFLAKQALNEGDLNYDLINIYINNNKD